MVVEIDSSRHEFGHVRKFSGELSDIASPDRT